jgi:hypothetical protein
MTDPTRVEDAIRLSIGDRFTDFYAIRSVRFQIDGETAKCINIAFVMFDGSVIALDPLQYWTSEDLGFAIQRIGKKFPTGAMNRLFSPWSRHDERYFWQEKRESWLEQSLADALHARDEMRENIRDMKRQKREATGGDDEAMYPVGAK